MKDFCVIVNTEKDNSIEVCHYIRKYLDGRGGGCDILTTGESGHIDEAEIKDGTECLITLGGDGTLIRAARDLARKNIPIIGINMGHLGYLTEIGSMDNIDGLLAALLENRYFIEERMMLEGTVWQDGHAGKKQISLNDITVREGTLRAARFDIFIDDIFLNEYNADGMLVATPTGSTAYNLSAGGPIAQPDGKMFIVTPICPHTLTSRTIVLGAECRIKIQISGSNRGNVRASFDGDARERLGGGDFIEIRKSDTVTRLMRVSHRSFLDILKHKLV